MGALEIQLRTRGRCRRHAGNGDVGASGALRRRSREITPAGPTPASVGLLPMTAELWAPTPSDQGGMPAGGDSWAAAETVSSVVAASAAAMGAIVLMCVKFRPPRRTPKWRAFDVEDAGARRAIPSAARFDNVASAMVVLTTCHAAACRFVTRCLRVGATGIAPPRQQHQDSVRAAPTTWRTPCGACGCRSRCRWWKTTACSTRAARSPRPGWA